jgi:hypothetical protein
VWIGPSADAAHAATRDQVTRSAGAYAASKGYHVGIAVIDTRTGATYTAGDSRGTFASESVVKVFIATRLLVSGRMSGSTERMAYKMITQSDDAMATALYGRVGGDQLINWVKQHFGLPGLGSPPRRAGWWGNTHITPLGMARFYAKIRHNPRIAPWLLHAMHHATTYGSDGTYQFFGLPSATSHPAVKQGWGCDYDDWCTTSADFNTTGFVDDDRYAVVILARGPLSTYGSAIASMLTRTARILLPGGQFPDDIPKVKRLSVHSGRTGGGTLVVVHGASFSDVQRVMFGSTVARRVTVNSTTELTVHAPPHAAGWTDVRIVTTHGRSAVTVADRFRYVAPPDVVSVRPSAGPLAGGTRLTVHGHNFLGVTSVLLGMQRATEVSVLGPRTLTAVAPAHTAGLVHVRVRTRYGLSPRSVADDYEYVAPPTVTGLSPATGPTAGGTAVVITGSSFRDVTAVRFGNSASTAVTIDSGTSLTVVAPPHTAGVVDVRVVTPYGTSKARPEDEYTYADPSPPTGGGGRT